MVKNLSQLKKTISAKQKFEIVRHYLHEECTGQIRRPNVVQTNGFYSIIEDEPDSKVSTANNGKGYWYGYGKASCYEFKENSVLFKLNDGRPVMEIRFI